MLGIDDKYDLHIPTIAGRSGKILHHTQFGDNLRNLVNFQGEPSFSHNINVASVNCSSDRNKTNEIFDKDVDVLRLMEYRLHEIVSDQKT